MTPKLTELVFRTLVFQYDSIDDQIKILQASKKKIITDSGITVSNFHYRRKSLKI